jgi:multiple sugar transport system ATP-binding protein
VKEAAEILGIVHLLGRKPKQLSGGQRQRVAVGRAIVREPAVFLFDEPLSNLDAKLRVQTRAEISKLHQRLKTTFIYVTHDQTEAMTMASRIAVMKDGVLQQLDTPQKLYDFPNNIFVAGFIGSPAMNFFDAKVVRDNGQLCADTGAFSVAIPPNRAAPYQNHVGKQVVLGIRPEDVHDPRFAPPDIHTALIPARVEVTELMGNEVFLYLKAGDRSFVGRVDPRTTARVENDIQVAVNMDNMHLFDKDTEQAIR